MNNPIRSAIQRRFEGARLAAMGGLARGAHALEVGCGRGVGVAIILERFGASRVDAFDLDERMVALARRRLDRYGERVRLWCGDVTDIRADSGAYQAVFDFGIVHHVPRWQVAVQELHRVLEPGGRLYAEEVLASFIRHPVLRRLFDHPMGNRFDHSAFCHALHEVGFELRADQQLWGAFGWYVADKPL